MSGKTILLIISILLIFSATVGSLEQNGTSRSSLDEVNNTQGQNGPEVGSPGDSDLITGQILNATSTPLIPEDNSLSNISGNQSSGNKGNSGFTQNETEKMVRERDDRGKDKDDPPRAEQELIVRFKTEPGKKMDNQVADKAHTNIGATVKKDLNGKGLPGTQVVEIPPGLTVDEAIALYAENPDVLSVEPNYRIALMSVPDDPDFSLQWGLLNTASSGADIGAVPAWDISTGDCGVLIAVPDTGIEVSHPDLADNIWSNTDELCGNGIDDDGNGYIDDVQGWDFVNNDADPSDDNGHGTHVAGITAAVGNNGIGITGVMWDAHVIPLKVIGSDGYGYESDAIEAILYAQQAGAQVISISWGSYGESQALAEAIANYPGLVVCAAGNHAQDNDQYPLYPSSYPSENIISVTATDENDSLAVFANYGVESVDIAAPGVGIYSTVPGAGYGTRSGTSMAAPFVAGVASLVVSKQGDIGGNDLAGILKESSDPLNSLDGRVSSAGRVNAENALIMAETWNGTTPTPTLTPTATVTPSFPPVVTEGEPQLAPPNPEFIHYLESLQSTFVSEGDGESLNYGCIPSPVNRSYLQGQILQISENEILSLPTSYDLRDYDRVTAVRNQGSCGSCWAFATYGSAESVLKTAETWDFSENNLKNLHGFDNWPCDGGNYDMSTAYLTRWSGPVSEADDPYSPSDIINSPSGLSPVKHVQDVLYIPGRVSSTDNDYIKYAVMFYGGVATAFYVQYPSSYYSPTYSSYYYNSNADCNHAVTIIGWDDNYNRNNFTIMPSVDGAFLVKNSWGTGWGDEGYFWISYDDSRLGRYFTNAVYLTEPATNYDSVYQYDPLGWVGSTGYGSNTAWAANVFTSDRTAQLNAVGFYAAAPFTAYDLSIYKNPENGPISNAEPVSAQSRTIGIPGYRTIPLDTPVTLNAGETFSIVVKLTTPGYNYPIAIEYPYPYYSSAATSEPGQSYISPDGTEWQDIVTWRANANVCIKGYFQTPRSQIGVFSDVTWYLDRDGNYLWDDSTADLQYEFGLAGDIPVTGDWNGDGTTSIGVFRPSTHTFYLDYNRNGVWNGPETDKAYNFGLNDDIPVSGDWGGLGRTCIGVFRPSTHTFYLDYNGNGKWDGAGTDRAYNFGLIGDLPVSGDWNGGGTTSIGVFRPSTRSFYLDYNGNGIWDGAVADRQYDFGLSADIPVTGDWDGLGRTSIGVFRPATRSYYLDYNGNGRWDGAGSDRQYEFGLAGDIPVTGDWNGSGTTSIGAFFGSTWYLDYNGNNMLDLTALDGQYNFGLTGDLPVTGDWNEIGRTSIGVFHPLTHTFYLDHNGNGVCDGAVTDRAYNFGLSGDSPISGDWNAIGRSCIGVFRTTTRIFYLDYNGNGVWDGAVTDRAYAFGLSGDIPVSGDWNEMGRTCIGVFRPSTHTFYLDYNGNGVWDGAVTDRAYNFGLAEDVPLTGDWDGLGKTCLGVYRPSTHTFYVDYNGNGRWDGAVIDRAFNFGLTGDYPVSGKW